MDVVLYDPASCPETFEYDDSDNGEMDICVSEPEKIEQQQLPPSSPPINFENPNDLPLSSPSNDPFSSEYKTRNQQKLQFVELSSDPIAGLCPPETSRHSNPTNAEKDKTKSSKLQPRKAQKTAPDTSPNPSNNNSEYATKLKNINNETQGSQEMNENHVETFSIPIPHTTKEAILQSRDLLIMGYGLAKDRNEQTRLLDLLEIFREYTEKGMLNKASTIIASQVANLETATRKIETQARDLKKNATPVVPIIEKQTTQTQSKPENQPNKTPISQILVQGTTYNPNPEEWTVVGNKSKNQQARTDYPQSPRKKPIRRVILVQAEGNNLAISPLHARNTINKLFANKGIKGPVVSVVSKTTNNNIAITTTDEYTADFLIEKKDIWASQIKHSTIQKDTPWYKVVAHGIPIADFNGEDGMEMIKEEVMTFNKGLKPIGTPHWISTLENRKSNRAGSVAIAFATEEEANRAIRNRLYIAGISVRVTKFYSVALTTQCQKCQGFGHLDTYCRKPATCNLCGENHSTQQHYCSVCKAKGKKCSHLAPKCANCQGSHQADSKQCEVFLAIKNRTQEPEL